MDDVKMEEEGTCICKGTLIQVRRYFSPADGLTSRKMIAMILGSLTGIGVLAFLSMGCGYPTLIASFGASAVLVYGAPNSPLAKSKNVLFGHLFSAIIGVIVYALLGCTWYSIAIAVTAAISLMLVTGTTHPPGGATALVAVITYAEPSFILCPVMLGAVVLLLTSWLFNHIRDDLEPSASKN